jgi:hypothetical protein
MERIGVLKKTYEYLNIQMRSADEVRFAHMLEMQRIAGEIQAWEYEPLTLDIAPNLECKRTYKPDFLMRLAYDGEIPKQWGEKEYLEKHKEIILPTPKPILFEVKGWYHNRNQDIKRFENAANLYIHKYRFFLVEWKNKQWKTKEYK